MKSSYEFENIDQIAALFSDEDTKLISFDMFNTLILRPYLDDDDIFEMLDKKYTELSESRVSFGRLRMEADSVYRRQIIRKEIEPEDITLDATYDLLEKRFLIDKNICDILKEEERKLQIKLCSARKTGKELFRLASATGKKIIITSDMFLTSDILLEMLNNCGYDIDPEKIKIYVSSETGLRKITGNLFRYISEVEKVSPENILHIGDNKEDDCEKGRLAGLRTAWLPSPISAFNLQGCCHQVEKICSDLTDWERAKSSTGIRCVRVMAANKFFDDPFRQFDELSDYNKDPYFVGYSALGPHLLAVSSWLMDNARRDNIDKLIFLARDGYLVKKAFEILYKDFDTSYLRVSRLSLLPLLMITPQDLFDMPIEKSRYSARKLLKLLEWCSNVAKLEEISHYDMSGDLGITEPDFCMDEPLDNDKYERFIAWFIKDIYDENKSAGYKKRILSFLRKELPEKDISEKNIAFFDMGYSGRIASCLADNMKNSPCIYYFHADPREHFRYERKSGFKIRSFFDFNPYMESTIREYSYLECAPSVTGYTESGEPVFDDGPAENYESTAGEMQRGALDFIKEYMDYFDGYQDIVNFRYHDVAMIFEAFIRYVNEPDIDMYKDIYIDDELYGGRRDINLKSLIEARRRKMPEYSKRDF